MSILNGSLETCAFKIYKIGNISSNCSKMILTFIINRLKICWVFIHKCIGKGHLAVLH